MAVAFVQEFPIIGDDRSTANYDALNDHVMASGVPDGLVSHSAGFDEDAGVFRISTSGRARHTPSVLSTEPSCRSSNRPWIVEPRRRLGRGSTTCTTSSPRNRSGRPKETSCSG